MSRHISKILLITAGFLIGLGSCRDDYMNTDADLLASDGRIAFNAYLEEGPTVSTRADEPEEPTQNGNPGLDSIYIAHDPWSQDFYLQLNTTGETGNDIVEYGVYNVPSAYEGRLESQTADKALNWQTLDNKHTFYAWTVPWMKTAEDWNSTGENPAGDYTVDSKVYYPCDDPVPVYFYNSSEEDGFKIYQNNAIYEGFIGAKSESYAYREHGKYVDLTFHHLVSKIKIASLILLQTDGTVQKDLQADMTFIGIPIQATFYPHPTTGDQSGAPAGWRPYVGAPYVDSPDNGVTYYINNRPTSTDVFYVCPEVDFSGIDYQIKITTKDYETLQTYYGTFDDVVFQRKPGVGYDRGENSNGEITDTKILHAGEMMSLNIVLIPGKGPGLKVIIEDWSTEQPRESQYHSHAGFYSDAELQEMMDLLYRFTKEDFENPPPELELLFEMYGYTKDGKKYFPLYENMDPTKGNGITNIFPIPPGYIIDGMGHIVTLKTNYGNYWSDGPANYFNIGGICRDIYFSDENGNNTIYIDKDGFIWVTNPDTGQLEITENQVPDEIPAPYRGMDISCKSGKIRYSEYYNDQITG